MSDTFYKYVTEVILVVSFFYFQYRTKVSELRHEEEMKEKEIACIDAELRKEDLRKIHEQRNASNS